MSFLTRMAAAHHLRLGLRMARRGRFTRAVREYRKAIERDPNSAHAHLHMAQSLAALGEMQRAVAAAERSLQLAPRQPAFLILSGEVFLDAGMTEKARALFTDALRINPANRLARAYAVMTRWQTTGEPSAAVRLKEEGLPDSTDFLGRLLLTVEERLRTELQTEAARAPTGPRPITPLVRLLSGTPGPSRKHPILRKAGRRLSRGGREA